MNPIYCSNPYPVDVSSEPKYLSSEVTKNTGCGSEAATWVLSAKTGQKIAVSLLDFFWDKDNNGENCIEYGYVIDRRKPDMFTICGGSKRITELLTSDWSTIKIALKSEAVKEYRFLLKIEGTFSFLLLLMHLDVLETTIEPVTDLMKIYL